MSRTQKRTAQRRNVGQSASAAGPNSKRQLASYQNYFLGLILITVTLLAYQPAWNGQPLMDDEMHLITTPELRSVSGLVSLWIDPQTTRQYHPLVDTVFWVEDKLWGSSMLGYHLVNIVLHIAAAFMLLKILRVIEIPGAWLATAVFALHPVQADSVAWIVELKNTLSSIFFFGCVLAYLRFDRNRTRASYALVLLLFCVGLLAKAIVAMFAVTALIVFWWKRGRLEWNRDVKPIVPFVVLGITAGLFTAWMERNFSGAEPFALSFLDRVLIAGRSFWFYVSKIFWPSNLMFIYPRWDISAAVWWQYLFPLGALCVFATSWILRKRSRWLLAGLLFFGAMLLPLLGFVDMSFFRYSFVADHFQYLAMLGIIVPLSAGGTILLNRSSDWPRIAGYGLCLTLLAALAALTFRHSEMYRDLQTCSRMILEKNPTHWIAQNNLGVALLQKGEPDAAIAHFDLALEKAPRGSKVGKMVHYNLGSAFSKKGLIDEAIAQFEKALSIDPSYAAAHHNLANALRHQRRFSEAIAQYEYALKIEPRSALTMNNLGWMLATCPDPSFRNGAKAVEIAEQADRVSGGGDPLILHTLAAAYAENGQFSQAIETAQRALQLAEDQRKSALIRALPGEIALYRAASPYHEIQR